jgi:hypothetical protein
MDNRSQIHAVDHLGNWYYNLGKHPRKTLMARIGCKHVTKMYRDDPLTKEAVHEGYVIKGLWLTIVVCTPWAKPAKMQQLSLPL